MNATGPLASALNFVFSGYGLVTLLVMLGLFSLLWSDQLKRHWHDRVERKKWEHWNVPKPTQGLRVKGEDHTVER
jgi:hypothetical protein